MRIQNENKPTAHSAEKRQLVIVWIRSVEKESARFLARSQPIRTKVNTTRSRWVLKLKQVKCSQRRMAWVTKSKLVSVLNANGRVRSARVLATNHEANLGQSNPNYFPHSFEQCFHWKLPIVTRNFILISPRFVIGPENLHHFLNQWDAFFFYPRFLMTKYGIS